MTREEVFNIIATLLEEGGEIEVVSERIMEALEVLGEDLLDHLDPPVGLRKWLESHGLSLVVTSEITPPQVWEAIQGEAVEAVEEKLEIEPTPTLQVGDYVEFQTATAGPRGQSRIGSGRIKMIHRDRLNDDINDIEVEFSPGGAGILLFPGADFIRVISPPGP
jgi:hypothetical protein